MSQDSQNSLEAVKAALIGIGTEIEMESLEKMDEKQKKLAELSKELLKLERDLTIPGSPTPQNVRVERLMKFIEEKDFQ